MIGYCATASSGIEIAPIRQMNSATTQAKIGLSMKNPGMTGSVAQRRGRDLRGRRNRAGRDLLQRLRALQDTGVIRGFHADIDPARVGRSLQAMICVRMQGHSRAKLSAYLRGLAGLPGVLNVYLLGGAHDFFIHVAVPDTEALNDFVIEHLSANPDVALTETNLIFQHAHAPAFH